jgi:LPS-assembly lipoprotein
MKRNLLAALALLPALGGCGFTPLYADQGLVGSLEHVQVEAPQTRTGYLMREQLQDRLAIKRNETPEYRLVINLDETRLARGMRPNATADRYETRLRVNYTLTRISTGEVMLRRSHTISVTSDAAAQPYAGISAQQDAQERAAWEASEFIKTQLFRVLASK